MKKSPKTPTPHLRLESYKTDNQDSFNYHEIPGFQSTNNGKNSVWGADNSNSTKNQV